MLNLLRIKVDKNVTERKVEELRWLKERKENFVDKNFVLHSKFSYGNFPIVFWQFAFNLYLKWC